MEAPVGSPLAPALFDPRQLPTYIYGSVCHCMSKALNTPCVSTGATQEPS
jgi:hypothetical protein